LAERRDIEYFLNQGNKPFKIAKKIKRAYSSIWDEIKRNSVNGKYEAKKAHRKSYARRKYSKYQGMKVVANPKLREKVEIWLINDQSPEGISKRIKRQEKNLPNISHDSISRFIKSVYGRTIEYHRNKRKKPRRRRGKKAIWKNKKSIHDRPVSIDKRRHIGDAEGDFIESGKSGKGKLFVVIDRKLRVKFLEKISRPDFVGVKRAGRRIKKRYPEWRTMTTDNDLLFEKHEELEIAWDINIYFCDTHSPWRKPSVENTNKDIRRDIPKGSNISKYSVNFIKKLETKLNNKFMDCLNSLSPAEALKRYRKNKKRADARMNFLFKS
jgi:IS30 family transposase